MATITAPVTFANVASVVLAGGTNLAEIIHNGNINKWAKYKPIVRAVIDTVTGQWNASANTWRSDASWWKGGDGHCGLSWTQYDAISSAFLQALMNGELQWTYTKPSGGSNSPYRLQDFAQYFSEAVPPVGALANAGGTIYVPASSQGTRTLTLNYDAPASGDLNLTLSDFATGGVAFTEFYLGVVLWKSSSNYRIVTSQNKIGNNGSTLIETQIGYSDIGTWKVMPFLSSRVLDVTSDGQAGTYLSAGYASPDTIIIASAGSVYQIYAEGMWSDTAYTEVGIQVTVKNNGSAAKTFSGGLTVYIYETDDTATSGSAGTLVAQYTYSTTFSVAANSQYTLPANQYNQLLDEYFVAYLNVTRKVGKEYWVTARFTDGTSIDNEYIPVQDVIMPDL